MPQARVIYTGYTTRYLFKAAACEFVDFERVVGAVNGKEMQRRHSASLSISDRGIYERRGTHCSNAVHDV